VEKNKSRAVKGRKVLVFFVERAPVGGMCCTKMAASLASLSTPSSTQPAARGALSLPFWHFLHPTPGLFFTVRAEWR